MIFTFHVVKHQTYSYKYILTSILAIYIWPFFLNISTSLNFILDCKANTYCSAVAQLLVSHSLHAVKADVEV